MSNGHRNSKHLRTEDRTTPHRKSRERRVIMESLTPEQVAEFREAFDFLDRNGDGHIHAKELGETLRNLGASPSDNELQSMLDSVDQDGDGFIDFIEFVTMITQLLVAGDDHSDIFRGAFDFFDKDGNGAIDADEVRYMLNAFHKTEFTMREIDWMISQCDVDGDGKVGFEEFCEILKSGLRK